MSRIVSKFILAASISLAMALTFSCSPNKEDDGNGGGSNCSADFRTVTIGTQTWMAENLNCNVKGSKCYDNDPGNCNKYGRLYDWATAMGLPSSCNSNSCSGQIQQPHRGICPDGWHIPSEAEWDTLVDFAGGYNGTPGPGTKLKATSGWDPSGFNGNGTDDYGFSALPGGFGFPNGSFSYVSEHAYWWSTSEGSSSSTYYREMTYGISGIYTGNYDKSFLFSIRCVQN